MKIIIVGLGQTGSLLLGAFDNESYEVSVIDQDRRLVDAATDKYNVNGIVGSGASREVLLAAGADTADAIVALTHIDEINLLSCMQAKALGTRFAAARILSPEFVREAEELKKEYHIDFFMKPRPDVAEEIFHNMGMPGFTKLEGFWGDKLQILNVSILDDSVLKGRSLLDIKQSVGMDILVVSVLRGGKLYIPRGDFILDTGDNVNIVMARRDLDESLVKLGILRSKAKKIVIVGGSTTCDYLMGMLKKKGHCDITILEHDPVRCRQLMEQYPEINVAYADGDTLEILEEEKVSGSDMIVSLTNHDETNLVISMYAWSCNVPSIITRVDRPEHVKLLHKVNIDITVSPAESSALKAMRFLRSHEAADSGKDIGKFYLLADGMAEIMELPADEDFKCLGKLFRDKSFRLKKDVLVAGILRGGELIIPSGNTDIRKGDRVIVTSTRKNHIRSLNEMLL
ncbi:MAG: Trk system potassium transporter TrkA [Lachnospiraceae bacterium]|nr:Trk system potassium transporter TrkA [Lachnospiraceae bacterium]